MSIQQVFSVILALISSLGILGASQLAMTRGANLGPGAAPMAYAIILLGLSIMLFQAGKRQPKISWRELTQKQVRDGVVFYGLILLLLALMHLLGIFVAVLVFSIVGLLYLKGISTSRSILFSLCWTMALYLLFVVLFHVPFETGLLFR